MTADDIDTANMTAQEATAELHRQLVIPMDGTQKADSVLIWKLIHAGADVNAPDGQGMPPLLRFLSWVYPTGKPLGHTDAISKVGELLFTAGADINALTPKGETARELASRWSDRNWMVQKLEREAYRRSDPRLMTEVLQISTTWPQPGDVVTDQMKRTFVIACHNGMMDEIRYYLYLYPEAVNWHEDTWNAAGGNGLMSAIKHGGHNLRVAELLIERGADVNWQNNSGMTALHYAIVNGNGSDAFIPLLIAAGADENIVNDEGLDARALAAPQAGKPYLETLESAITLRDAEFHAEQAAIKAVSDQRSGILTTHKRRDGVRFRL